MIQNTMKKIRQLAHIKNVFPAYKAHFDNPRTKWLTTEYLSKELKDAEQFFANKQEIDDKTSQMNVDFHAKRNSLEAFYKAARNFAKGYLDLEENEGLASNGFPKSHDTVEKSKALLRSIDQFILQPELEFPFVDFSSIKSELEHRIQEYESVSSEIDNINIQSEAMKQEFMKKTKHFADVYHWVVNAIEGELHDDRETLLKMMPWRKKKAERVVKNEVVVENVENQDSDIQ